MTAAKRWVLGARPRTLPAALVPVMVGTGVAYFEGSMVIWKAGLALVVSLALQIATNYVNDYADGERGTDDDRVGPPRLVGGGLATAKSVKTAALLAFGVAAAAGLVLALTTSLWLLLVGAACVAAAYFYTGGSKPYGYAGFGELFVFVFFGLIATIGTAVVQTQAISSLAVTASIPVGFLAVALLMVNNLRDIPGDEAVGKRTLAVRLGDDSTRQMYEHLLYVSFYSLIGPLGASRDLFTLLPLVCIPLALRPYWRVSYERVGGAALIPVLVQTSRLQLAYGLLLTAGLVLAAQ